MSARELLSNKDPLMEGTLSWDDTLHLKHLGKDLIPGINSSSFLDYCLPNVADDLSDGDQFRYSQQCLNYLMGEANLNRNLNNYNDSIHDGSVIKGLPEHALQEFPEELTHINMTNLIAYSVLFPLAAVGNLLVLVALFRSRHRKSRVNLMILHLSLADMIVTFIFLPMEIIWQVTIQWPFGRIGCKLYKFFSAFGFYMSSMVLVCISLDRYFAVLHPLKVNDAQRRGKIMLFFAWIISAFISLPQVYINS